MEFLYLKAIHIIFVVSWFAALFYIVRLFIYTTEAQQKPELEKEILSTQLLLMQKKLWNIIGWPAMLGTTIFGVWMLWQNPAYLFLPWMWLKLIAVVLLISYHLYCHLILKRQQQRIFKNTSFQLRLFNELATVLLVAIVFLVVIKSSSGLLWGLLGLLAFAGTMMIAVLLYKKARAKNRFEEVKRKDLK
jgi:protoporphyrinogen IX oxidase